MSADEWFRVPVLDKNQARKLFQQKLGREALDSRPELRELAMDMADECRGLPLALLTVSRAMSTKKTIPEWERAIDTLKRYAFKFSGMEEQVFAPLKFSYDSLENDTLRKCFLYCSLYGEDQYIPGKHLVEQWIGEGFLDESQNLDEARRQGHDIIGSLNAACLLERHLTGATKMHDTVRDMALWITRDAGKKKNKTVVEAYVGLTEAPDMESWKDAERVSLMESSITELSEPIQSPCLLTLLLRHCRLLSTITPDFFQYMPLLRVLNLSCTGISEIPNSIGDLAELRYLNLSFTKIRTLPERFANLSKLRLLDLSWTAKLKEVPRGVIPRLLTLQSLNLMNERCHPSVVEEVESLEHLKELHITVEDCSGLSDRLKSCLKGIWIINSERLTHFQLATFLLHGNFKELKELAIISCKELEELSIDFVETDHKSKELLCNLEKLRLVFLPKLNKLWTTGTSNHGHFKKLQDLTIIRCHALKEMSCLVLLPFLRELYICGCKEIEEILADEGPSVGNRSIFTRVEYLHLVELPKLLSISRVALSFPSLTILYIRMCPFLKKLPFTSNSTNKPFLRIMCETEWWGELEWEDETLKTFFQSSFYPHSDNLSVLRRQPQRSAS